ncbi:MAG: alpha/beta hydrolase [Myxococcaceae bacterium]
MKRILGWSAGVIGFVLVVGIGYVAKQLPELGAGGLLYPFRRPMLLAPPDGCAEVSFQGAGVVLRGWRCQPKGAKRGVVVSLHGVADNRASSVRVIERMTARGFEVIAYDSRRHGQSGGEACTYGFFEKHDLHRVVDKIEPGPVVLMGHSLGAAVALQAAAEDRRIRAVVAAESFSDLRTVATERAPFFFTAQAIEKSFALAERRADFVVDAVSPAKAAEHIVAPVLLVHGSADVETPPDHSRRIFAKLRGPKRLILVPNAGHNASLREDVWSEVTGWIDAAL